MNIQPLPMKLFVPLRIFFFALVAGFFASCELEPTTPTSASNGAVQRIQNVRTTAYTHSEFGGHHNAIGARLARENVKSAAADWSRYPLGTRFRIASTKEEFVVDDYGGALIGTGTIDLYKTSRASVRAWGVRHVDLEILHWGSKEESLKILRPRKHNRLVRRMIAALETKKT